MTKKQPDKTKKIIAFTNFLSNFILFLIKSQIEKGGRKESKHFNIYATKKMTADFDKVLIYVVF